MAILRLAILIMAIVSALEKRAAVEPLGCKVRLRAAVVVHLVRVRVG